MNYDAYEGSMNEHGMVWHGDIYTLHVWCLEGFILFNVYARALICYFLRYNMIIDCLYFHTDSQ